MLLNRQLTAFVKPQVSRAGLQQVRAWPLALGAQRLLPAPAPAPCPLPSGVRLCEGGVGGRGSHLSPHAFLCCLHFSHMCLLVRTSKFYSLLSALSKDLQFLHFNYEVSCSSWLPLHSGFSYFVLLPAPQPSPFSILAFCFSSSLLGFQLCLYFLSSFAWVLVDYTFVGSVLEIH